MTGNEPFDIFGIWDVPPNRQNTYMSEGNYGTKTLISTTFIQNEFSDLHSRSLISVPIGTLLRKLPRNAAFTAKRTFSIQQPLKEQGC